MILDVQRRMFYQSTNNSPNPSMTIQLPAKIVGDPTLTSSERRRKATVLTFKKELSKETRGTTTDEVEKKGATKD